MKFGLAAFAAVAVASCVTPALSMDWTGWYAGIYSGVGLRSGTDFTGAFVAGTFGQDGGLDTPDTQINSGGIDPTLFSLFTQARDMYQYVTDAEATGYVVDGSIGYGPGFALGTTLGYSFGNGFRAETDWSVLLASPTSLTIDGTLQQNVTGNDSGNDYVWTLVPPSSTTPGASFDISGMSMQTTAAFVLGNAWYDFDNDTAFTPYVGGGVGVANVNSTVFIPGLGTDTASAWVPAGQLGAGVLVDLNERSFLDLGYRLKAAAAGRNEFSAVEDLGTVNFRSQFIGLGFASGGPVTVHTLQAGLNVKLN